LPTRSFEAVITLDPLSRAELDLLHRRQFVVVDVSGISADRVATESLLDAAALSLAARAKVMSNRRMWGEGAGCLRVLIVEGHDNLRSTLTRGFRIEAERRGRPVDVHQASRVAEALDIAVGLLVDVVITDVCVEDIDHGGGVGLIARLRKAGFDGHAFVLAAMRDYALDAAADAVGARCVPKENLNVDDLISRVLNRSAVPSETPSSVRLRRLSREDVASYLAQENDGLHTALARARSDAVRKVVGECGGNRTAAARRLRMTRQQVQVILDDDPMLR
jgi:ActR/RegA family two-component response regulator